MFRYPLSVLAVVAMALTAGCESQNPLSQGPPRTEQPRLAAYSATAQYPNVQASNDLTAAAMVDKDNNITIHNFSDQTLKNAKVWVNGAYVRWVGTVPAHSSLTIDAAQFYNGQGLSLSTAKTRVDSVQVQTDDHLYNLQGPQYK